MAAYLVAKLVVTDPEAYEQYRSQVPATIAAYGGRYIVRGVPSIPSKAKP